MFFYTATCTPVLLEIFEFPLYTAQATVGWTGLLLDIKFVELIQLVGILFFTF